MKKTIAYIACPFLLFSAMQCRADNLNSIGIATGIQKITWEQDRSSTMEFHPIIINYAVTGTGVYWMLDFQSSSSNTTTNVWSPYGDKLMPSQNDPASDYDKYNMIVGYSYNDQYSFFGGYHVEQTHNNFQGAGGDSISVDTKHAGLIIGGSASVGVDLAGYHTALGFSASFGSLRSNFQAENSSHSKTTGNYKNFGLKWSIPVNRKYVVQLSHTRTQINAAFSPLEIDGVSVNPDFKLTSSSSFVQFSYLYR